VFLICLNCVTGNWFFVQNVVVYKCVSLFTAGSKNRYCHHVDQLLLAVATGLQQSVRSAILGSIVHYHPEFVLEFYEHFIDSSTKLRRMISFPP